MAGRIDKGVLTGVHPHSVSTAPKKKPGPIQKIFQKNALQPQQELGKHKFTLKRKRGPEDQKTARFVNQAIKGPAPKKQRPM